MAVGDQGYTNAWQQLYLLPQFTHCTKVVIGSSADL